MFGENKNIKPMNSLACFMFQQFHKDKQTDISIQILIINVLVYIQIEISL